MSATTRFASWTRARSLEKRLAELALGSLAIRHEKPIVELWRGDARSRQHRVHLPAVVNLVNEQVREHITGSFDLRPRSSLERHLVVEGIRGALRQFLRNYGAGGCAAARGGRRAGPRPNGLRLLTSCA
jgi:hypothetical protein